MADNILLPRDVAKVVEVRDTSRPLYNFLLKLTNTLNQQNTEIAELKKRVEELENAG